VESVLLAWSGRFFNLLSEIQVRDFDAILAHFTIVMIRYVFLAVEQRMASDQRTIGGLFLATGEEIHDISLAYALIRILSLALDRVREFYATSEELVREIIECTMKEALRLIKPRFHAKSES